MREHGGGDLRGLGSAASPHRAEAAWTGLLRLQLPAATSSITAAAHNPQLALTSQGQLLLTPGPRWRHLWFKCQLQRCFAHLQSRGS